MEGRNSLVGLRAFLVPVGLAAHSTSGNEGSARKALEAGRKGDKSLQNKRMKQEKWSLEMIGDTDFMPLFLGLGCFHLDS